MISSNELQTYYVQLYKQLMNYIWDFETVEDIAELEIAIYKAFPDLEDVNNRYQRLYNKIRPVIQEDEELKLAMEELKSAIDESDEVYTNLKTFKEVLPV